MDAAWVWILLAVALAIAGYFVVVRGRPSPPMQVRPPKKKTIVVTVDPATQKCRAKTTPPVETLSVKKRDTIKWNVQAQACLNQHPGAVVQIRFEGASPLEPPAPHGPDEQNEIAAQVSADAPRGTYKYVVYLKMPKGTESYPMEDPELIIDW